MQLCVQPWGIWDYGISNAITVLDVSKVIISGHFGPDGDVIVPLLEEEIRANVLPKKDLKVDYLEYDPDGWVKGAALLILKDYLVDVPGKIRNS